MSAAVNIPLSPPSEVVYGLDSKPPFSIATLAALQHLMAMFVGIITPPIIISQSLDLPIDMRIYLIGVALFVGGIGTFLQVRMWGPIGSGLLSMQGVSFIFLGSIISAGMAVKNTNGSPEEIVAAISGVTLMGAFVQIGLSRMARLLKRIFTPLVSGITVALVGLSLIKVGMTDFCGGMVVKMNHPEQFASLENLGLGTLVLLSILILNRFSNPIIRTSAIIFGLMVGYVVAAGMGKIDFTYLSTLPFLQIPTPLKYGMSFHLDAFLAISVLYVLSTVEAVGDLSATSMLSGRPVEGEEFIKRLKGGICCDGVSSVISALFNSTPMAIFAQNNGVIQITGVASRHVGKYIAAILVIMGIFPIVGGLFAIIPPSVLGGATLLLFGSVGAAGIKIISSTPLNRRAMLIIGLSFGVGFGVAFVPELAKNLHPILQEIFHSAVTAGGSTAILANLCIPEVKTATGVADTE